MLVDMVPLLLLCNVVQIASLTGSFEILSALRSKGIADFELCLRDGSGGCSGESVVTDANGTAKLEMAPYSDFVVLAQKKPQYQDLYIVGYTGNASFRYPTYMGTRLEAEALAVLLRRRYSRSLGAIVVGMDVRGVGGELEPAVGASAFVSGIVGPRPFIFDHNILPIFGQTVLAKSSGFVTWTNMEVNTTGTVEVTPPDGMTCPVSPGLTSRAALVSVRPDSVMVVSYICENATQTIIV